MEQDKELWQGAPLPKRRVIWKLRVDILSSLSGINFLSKKYTNAMCYPLVFVQEVFDEENTERGRSFLIDYYEAAKPYLEGKQGYEEKSVNFEGRMVKAWVWQHDLPCVRHSLQEK